MTDGWKELYKTWGEDVLFRADEPTKSKAEIVPFDSPSLCDATHFWGLPRRKLSMFFGPTHGGKTFLAMLQVRALQRLFPDQEVVWVDAESSFDRVWARNLGLNLERIKVIDENDGAEVFRILLGKFTKGKKVKPGILDFAMEGKLKIGMVVIDSVAHLIPAIEDGRDFDEQEMAALPRFLPKPLRQLTKAVRKCNAIGLLINQARESMDQYGPKYIYPGGNVLKHAVSLAINIDGIKAKDAVLGDPDRPHGRKTRATIVKTRGGPNGYQAEFWLDFYKGVVRTGEEIATLGHLYGIVDRPNNRTWEYGDLKVVGKENFFQTIDEDQKLGEEILNKIRKSKEEGIIRSSLMDHESEEARMALDDMRTEIEEANQEEVEVEEAA